MNKDIKLVEEIIHFRIKQEGRAVFFEQEFNILLKVLKQIPKEYLEKASVRKKVDDVIYWGEYIQKEYGENYE
jgi:hypothetical protein